MIRLFVGIALPDQHRERLSLMAHGLHGARWVAPENLHVTMRFIGEVDEDKAEDLSAALDPVTAEPFELRVQGLGTFGDPAHVLWAGVADTPKGALAELYGRIESALVREGLEPEHRKFAPHVTLARFRKGHVSRLAQYMEAYGDLAMDPFEVTGFTLYRSHLAQDGAHYDSVAEYDF